MRDNTSRLNRVDEILSINLKVLKQNFELFQRKKFKYSLVPEKFGITDKRANLEMPAFLLLDR